LLEIEKPFKIFFLLLVFVIGTIIPLIPAQKVEAAGEKYTFYYPGGQNNTGLVRDINNAIKSKSKEDDVLSNTAVYAKGGIWSTFSNNPIRLSYNPGDS